MFDNIPEHVDELLENPSSSQATASSKRNSMKKTTPHHKLETKWKVWYHHTALTPKENNRSQQAMTKNDQLNVSLIDEFDTVEGFWSVYRKLEAPSATSCGICFQIFPDGEAPAESATLRTSGGKFSFIIGTDELLNEAWERLLLAIVGGQLESLCPCGAHEDTQLGHRFLSGIIFGKRKVGGRFVLLTRANVTDSAPKKEDILTTCKAIRALCRLPQKVLIEFNWYSHSSEMHLKV